MYQRILVPVDGSVTSQMALKEVARFAQLCPNAAIRLIHVVDVTQSTVGITEFASNVPSLTEMEDAFKKSGQDALDRAAEEAKELGFSPEAVLVNVYSKQIAAAIVEDAQSWNADLIIMGTHGYTGLTHLLVGSVAEGVIRHAPVPILLVRAKA
ncbi:MAG: universal stress protein [Formivibrio sp.]|nr:universal stress protein [Formivibrio sp.]